MRELNLNEMEMVSGGQVIGYSDILSDMNGDGLNGDGIAGSPAMHNSVASTLGGLQTGYYGELMTGEDFDFATADLRASEATPTEGESALDLMAAGACATPPGVAGATLFLGCTVGSAGAGAPACAVAGAVTTVATHVGQTLLCTPTTLQ